jgi:membrane-associated phospholipid phosphatase
LIWTTPFGLHGSDAKVFAAFTAGTAALIATDRFTSAWIDNGGSLSPISRGFSEAGAAYGAGGIAAGMYVVGKLTHRPRLTETGLLAGEAYLDSGILVGVVKLATQRPRPNLDSGSGRFFAGGMSFPSGHSSSAWSVATVIAYEYRKRKIIQIGAYAAATAVALARYSGRYHFMSEILMGSAVGFYTGRFVYHTRHVPLTAPTVDEPPRQQTTKLMPMVVPFFDGRSRTYGARASWTF